MKIKNIENVKRCRDVMPKSMQTRYTEMMHESKGQSNKVEMMHESKGQCSGKAPSLHLFHTTVRHHP